MFKYNWCLKKKEKRNNYHRIIMYSEKVADGGKAYAVDANESFLLLQTEVQKYIEKRRREFITPSSARKSSIDIPYTGIGKNSDAGEIREDSKVLEKNIGEASTV